MYDLDLTHVRPETPVPLGDTFSGTSADGRMLGFTSVSMTLNGRPVFAVSGEMHFSRVSPDQWEDTLLRMKAGGVDIVATYVFWNVHEEERGRFRFDGGRDLRAFLGLCRDCGMAVILRVGPFDHGEMRNGGLPDWLYGQPFEVRGQDTGYLACVRRWYAAIHAQADGFYFSQNGPIIAIQLENEYMHSSAPWEMTAGTTNEWVNGGQGGEVHILTLKRIAREEGLCTPFYTCTAWGGAMAPADEVLPLWGGYAYQPWIFYHRRGEHPCTPEYHYRDLRNDATPHAYNFEPGYAPESRPYACCELMGGMMCGYNYRFTLPMKSVDALANIKLGSGCAMLGYYMYRGGTTPTGARTPFLNEGQICHRSYDYQAPIGEFGQLRESYFRLRTLHDFCHSFEAALLGGRAVVPAGEAERAPEDARYLRYSARVKGGAGFVFIDNFQDHMALPDRFGETVTLHLPGETLRMGPFDIAGGENAILPFHMDVAGLNLRWASAQPITRLNLAGEDVFFFLAPDGMTPEFHFDGIKPPRTKGCETCAEGGEWVCRPRRDSQFTVDAPRGTVRVVVLSREMAGRFYHFATPMGEVAVLSDGAAAFDGQRLRLLRDGSACRVMTWPAGALHLPEDAPRAAWLGFDGAMLPGRSMQPPEVNCRQVGPYRWAVDVPAKALSGHGTVLLHVAYLGDVGEAFVDGEMISDNFCNGQPWDIRLDDRAAALAEHPLTLRLTPIKRGASVNVDSAMAARMERVEGQEAALEGLELVWMEETRLSLRRNSL